MNKDHLWTSIEHLLRDITDETSISYDILHEPPGTPGILIELPIDGMRPARFVVELCADPRLARVQHAAHQAHRYAQQAGAFPAVAVPRLGPKLRQYLRDVGVGYLSLDGQVYLRGGGILIDRKLEEAGHLQTPQRPNLFADKSSLLLRHLLSHRAVPLGIRDVAGTLGISPGLASRVVSTLKDEGYLIERDGLSHAAGRDALLAEWEALYRQRARRQHERRLYLHARDVSAVLSRLADHHHAKLPRWGLSFHAGASLVAPYAFFSEVHVVLGGPSWDDAAGAFARLFGLEPATQDANMVLVRPYYRESWDYGLREIEGLPVVSDVQLFLDLSVYPRRGAEQAGRIRERILALEHNEGHS